MKIEQPNFEEVFSFENLMKCADKCGRDVRWKASVQSFLVHQCEWCMNLHNDLVNGKFRSKGFREFYIMERGKKRFIQSVHIAERVVQKALTEYALKPIVEPLLIYDNGASRTGKGTQFAVKRLRQHLSYHYRKHGRKGGILVMDLHDYFHSIDQDILLAKYREIIEDERIYNMAKYFIRQFKDGGLGLGSEISQISAIYYPNEIDHFASEHPGVSGYARYMDDSYVISYDLDLLKRLRKEITDMYAELGIEMNQKKTRIVKFEGGHFEFLKRRFQLTETGQIVMRPVSGIFTKWRKELKKKARLLERGEISMDSIRQSYYSRRGGLAKCDCGKSLHDMDLLYESLFHEKIIPTRVRRRKYLKNIQEQKRTERYINEVGKDSFEARYAALYPIQGGEG